MSAARETFQAALVEFRKRAEKEVAELTDDIGRARGRGLAILAADLAIWRTRLVALLELAENARKEPGAPR
ncbi:MAG TPA: hypothetical protein VGQ48_14235 [Gemmatimonadales bacterium]|jgi:hypothetical protein|nr:hypothetical protein [Gemmatimonadales bacterium]